MNLRAVLLVAAGIVAFAPSLSARAGGVRISFANGRVTVTADNATVTEILREWERVGGSRFVNAEKIPGMERLTLRLENETETRAIEVVLRSVAGYVIAPQKPGASAASGIGNVLIVPTSRAASYAQAPRPAIPMVPTAPAEEFAPVPVNAGQPRPDDEGPVRREMPPPAPTPMPTASTATQTASQASGAPLGYANPLQGVQTQSVPGLGTVTSSQPGQTPPRQGGRPVISPTQPRRGGGGG